MKERKLEKYFGYEIKGVGVSNLLEMKDSGRVVRVFFIFN